MRPLHVMSLWDMLAFAAPQLATSLYNMGLLCERFVNAASNCEKVGAHSVVVSKETIQGVALSLHAVAAVANGLQLAATLGACSRAIDGLKWFADHSIGSGSINFDHARQFGYLLSNIPACASDEFAAITFVSVSNSHKVFVNAVAGPFGDAVDDAFPDAVEDLQAAGKCIAFEQSTASVFHLMRAMECAVARLAFSIGVARTDVVWGNLLSSISTAIEVMPKGPRKDQWSESHTHLYHVKQAWRNSTMHPKKTHTKEEAEAIFSAVGSFMRHLVDLLEPA